MFVIQNIRQPEQFFYTDYLSSAKRYKTKAGAERAIAKYRSGHYIIIDEAQIGTPEHKELFVKARVINEKEADQVYREHSKDFMPSLPELPESHFEKLALDAWNRYLEEHLSKA